MGLSLCIELNEDQRAQLLGVARSSILHGLEHGVRLQPEVEQFDRELLVECAVFITLTSKEELRGCIGSLQARLPLLHAVADAAYNAAFRDRRFAPVKKDEMSAIRIEISVLSEMEPIIAADRETLLQNLQPGIDGLLLEDQGYRATFLPKVWEKIGSSGEFLEHLMLKAGLAPHYWSGTIRFHRYHTLSFAES